MNVGLVGISGSGKTTVSEYLQMNYGFTSVTLSKYVRDYANDIGANIDKNSLSDISDKLKATYGQAYLAQKVYEQIRDKEGKYIIDGIRNPEELVYLKTHVPKLITVGLIVESIDELIQRILKRQKDSDLKTEKEIKELLERELYSKGMRVAECLPLCDIKVYNNQDFSTLHTNICNFLI